MKDSNPIIDQAIPYLSPCYVFTGVQSATRQHGDKNRNRHHSPLLPNSSNGDQSVTPGTWDIVQLEYILTNSSQNVKIKKKIDTCSFFVL